MNEQQKLRNKINANQFASWELRLFLDTHPDNKEALMMQKEYQKKSEELIKEYEEKYGPMNVQQQDTARWSWINDPWPWEMEGNE